MEKILYFDCACGISGDMALGALVDAGLPLLSLKRELAKLPLKGYTLTASKVIRQGIAATRVRVDLKGTAQPHRRLGDIRRLIGRSRLSSAVKQRTLEAFGRLAQAEARVHGTSPEKIHFHEVGAVDALVDIAGTMIGLEALGIRRAACSPVNVGAGTVTFSHGTFPVPAPATAELLRGREIYASSGRPGELTTPTGAAIVTSLTRVFEPLPRMRVERVGTGAGSREVPGMTNCLRVFIGAGTDGQAAEEVAVLETQVDDATGQELGYLMERLMAGGALDAFLTPIQMKKNRPGIMITALCPPARQEEFVRLLLDETPTLGVRVRREARACLDREFGKVRTPYGAVAVKTVLRPDGRRTAQPEYEDCAAAARRHRVPLRRVMDAARAASGKG